MKSISLLIILFSVQLLAENIKEKIIVGTKIAEPFVIENQSGELSGISIDLWNHISNELNSNVEFKKYDLDGLLLAVKSGEVDIAASPLTITSERENIFDFTHAYFTTGLSIAVSKNEESSWLNLITKIFSSEFMKVVGVMFIVLFLVGFLVWLFERSKNKEEFGDGVTKGLGSSFWWAAVTMTTVGYGDKAPKTTGGRLIALIWMFAGLIMISSFTAAIASALTLDKLDHNISGLKDLYDVKVGTVNSSSSETYLNQNEIDFITTNNIEEGLKLISENKLDAFVYDEPIIKYYIKSNNISDKVRVLPVVLNPISYGFALPENSKLREKINRIILRIITTKEWNKIKNSYL